MQVGGGVGDPNGYGRAVDDDEDTSEMWFDWIDASTWTAPPGPDTDKPPATCEGQATGGE